MKTERYDVWSEPDIAGVEWHDIVELPANATQNEIEQVVKEAALEHFEWSYSKIE